MGYRRQKNMTDGLRLYSFQYGVTSIITRISRVKWTIITTHITVKHSRLELWQHNRLGYQYTCSIHSSVSVQYSQPACVDSTGTWLWVSTYAEYSLIQVSSFTLCLNGTQTNDIHLSRLSSQAASTQGGSTVLTCNGRTDRHTRVATRPGFPGMSQICAMWFHVPAGPARDAKCPRFQGMLVTKQR